MKHMNNNSERREALKILEIIKGIFPVGDKKTDLRWIYRRLKLMFTYAYIVKSTILYASYNKISLAV